MEVEDYNHTVSKEKSNLSPRRDLLRSYGSAVMVIAQRTYKKVEDQDGTIGWLARKLAFIAVPIFWFIRFQWLSQLSFIDRRIQTIEWITCKISPRSEIIFSKIDGLARVADSLPDKLDNVIDTVGGFVGDLPVLSVFNWVVEVIEEIFYIMMSFIPYFGSRYAEKSISLDNDMRLTYGRDENLQKIVDERLKEGGGILEKTDAIESQETKDDSIFSEGKPAQVEGEIIEKTDAAGNKKNNDDSAVSEGKPDRLEGEIIEKTYAADNQKINDESIASDGKPERVEGEILERTDAANNEKIKDDSIVSEGKSDNSKSKGDNKKGRKKKGKIK